MRDVIRAVRPRFVVAENVAALLRDAEAFSIILGDLSDDGFAVEWDVVSACAVGAPHTRRRLFLVAYPDRLDGNSRLGLDLRWDREAVESFDGRARAWRDQVDWAVEAARGDDRDVDGAASRLVAMGGNAVVPQVAEHIGRLIVAADEARCAA
jgi:DNA (cytosine-5)-methyltransferase 1